MSSGKKDIRYKDLKRLHGVLCNASLLSVDKNKIIINIIEKNVPNYVAAQCSAADARGLVTRPKH
ncbi:5346_t:CDS:2 [Rhizophagus irregularis]|nr:5346_t:CDS:2 [Rhizophagus irregularis]